AEGGGPRSPRPPPALSGGRSRDSVHSTPTHPPAHHERDGRPAARRPRRTAVRLSLRALNAASNQTSTAGFVVRAVLVLCVALALAWWSGYLAGLVVRGYHYWRRW